MTQKTKKIFSS